MTVLSDTYVPDEVLEEARKELSDTEVAKLVLASVAINGWKRFAISACLPVGGYQSMVSADA